MELNKIDSSGNIVEDPLLDKILALLYNAGNINNPEKMSFKKPTHGNCCTCQTCGYYHDECVCDDNVLIDCLIKILDEHNER